MKLSVYKRSKEKKGEINRLRREGKIPCVVYSKGNAGENVAVETDQIATLLREVKPGHLSTQVLTLVDDQNQERSVIIKDIQYHITSYRVLHLDFEELFEDVEVNLNIPIEFTDAMNCVGVKHGGVVRKVIRKMRVRCLPKNIPSEFPISVKELNIGQTKRLKDIQYPEGVKPLIGLHNVAVVIAKR